MKSFQLFFRILTLIVLCHISLITYSQNCNCPAADLQKFEVLKESNDSAALFQAIKQLKIGENKPCLVKAYTFEIGYLFSQRKLDGIPDLIQKQENLINGLPCQDELLIETYLNHARYFKAKEDYENMSLYTFKALENAEARKDKRNEFSSIVLVVNLFTRQNQTEKNWVHIKRAEKLIMGFEEDYRTSYNYNWLAMEYETKYTEILRPTLLDSALLFATKAKEAGVKNNDIIQTIQSFRVFESVAYHHDNIRQAVSYMDSALFYAKKLKTPAPLSSLYVAKAWDHYDLKEYSEAIRWMDTSIYYTEKFFHGAPASINVYSEAVRIYEKSGNISKALDAAKTFEHLKDSIFKVQRAEKINELEQKYNKSKNEKTIKELAQQKRIYLLLAVAGLFALLGLIFFIRQQSLKNKQKILETEQRLNRARMNPHFFFNALSSLQSFALEGNDGKSIATNLSKFSHIMRETLESTYKEYVTVEQESDFLKEYLELQKMRFPQKFSYEINIAASVEPDDTLIPSMILQPFAENSIEHGFAGINYPGHISLSFDKKGNDLHIHMSDNGKGLAVIPKENGEHISRATQIIRDRIYLLNIKLKTRAGFTIDNNPDGKGVSVKITLPVLFKNDIKS